MVLTRETIIKRILIIQVPYWTFYESVSIIIKTRIDSSSNTYDIFEIHATR